MKKMNRVISIMILVMLLVSVGCNGNSTKDVYDDQDNTAQSNEKNDSEANEESEQTNQDIVNNVSGNDVSLVIKGLNSSTEIKLDDILALTSVTRDIKSLTSDGEEELDQVQGYLLTDILTSIGESLDGVDSIRFTAGDGYAINVPNDIVASKDIILANVWNDNPLTQREQPLRVAINDVRSMYFVSNLVEIELKAGEDQEASSDEGSMVSSSEKMVIMMETAFSMVPSEEYVYYDSPDQAVHIGDLIETFDLPQVDEVAFVASDGYEKTEDYEVVQDCSIKYTGEDMPLFTAHELPLGMIIKNVMTMAFDDKAFVSLTSASDVLPQANISDNVGVSVYDLVKTAGLEADYYVLFASDGYSIEVSKDTLKTGVAYVNDQGSITVKFASDNPDKSNLKGLLQVTSGDGSHEKVFQSETAQTGEEKSTDIEGNGWTIVFEGLEDGSFDMTSDRAERKLERVSLHTERMKDDVIYPEDWEGYKLKDVLTFLKVETFDSLILVAEDGYEIVLNSDQVDDETIIAVVKDGEPISGGNPVQLVQNTEFATSWIKNLAKIIVQ